MGNIPAEFNFDWLAQENGGQFDPQLFGDYREPQNNILSAEDSFFNDAIDADFFTPYNIAPVGLPPRDDLMGQLGEKSGAMDTSGIKAESAGQDDINCKEVWCVILVLGPFYFLNPLSSLRSRG
jgi:AP-1-like factor